MGLILMAGGLVGSYSGVQIFKALRAQGQVDLLISLSYVLFLSVIGLLMLRESIQALNARRLGNPVRARRPASIVGYWACLFACAFAAPSYISASFRR